MEQIPLGTDLRPELDAEGLAPHGASWGKANEIVLRGVSRGPGIPIQVTHPLNGGPPRRVISGAGNAYLSGGALFIVPTAATAGKGFHVVAEF